MPGAGERKKKGARRPLLNESQRPTRGDAGVTALMVAAQFGSLQSIKRLLSEKADVDAVDARGWTALHWAAQESHAEACLALLQAGASAELADAEGRTATVL